MKVSYYIKNKSDHLSLSVQCRYIVSAPETRLNQLPCLNLSLILSLIFYLPVDIHLSHQVFYFDICKELIWKKKGGKSLSGNNERGETQRRSMMCYDNSWYFEINWRDISNSFPFLIFNLVLSLISMGLIFMCESCHSGRRQKFCKNIPHQPIFCAFFIPVCSHYFSNLLLFEHLI